MLNPSSSASAAHAWRHWALRVLQSPLLLLAQIRARYKRSGGGGGGRSSPVLPLYAPSSVGRDGGMSLGGGLFGDDSQAKHIKSKTLLQDLACFAFFLLCAFALLHALWPAPAATGDADATLPGFVEVELADDQPDSLAPPSPPPSPPPDEPTEPVPLSIGEPDRAGIDAAQASQQQQQQQQQASKEERVTNTLETVDLDTPAAPIAGGLDGAAVAPASGPSANGGDDAYAALIDSRRQAVRAAFLHSWSGYEQYAWGHDEIRPVSNASHDSWGGFGATLVDGLDTAMIMGLDDEVARARKHVESINFEKDYVASFFETAIRYLGGLLGAYEMSRDRLYLSKATQLADLLMRGFDSSPTGLPKSKINLLNGESSNQRWAGGSILAEVGSIQLELEYLSFHTGDRRYADAARKVYTLLDKAPKDVPGLYPTYIDADTGRFTNSHVSFGSFGDSFYEYTLKLWLLTDRRDQDALRMWNEAMGAMETHLLRTRVVSIPHPEAASDSDRRIEREYAFVGELRTQPGGGGSYTHKMEHLTCFLPGLLALGVAAVADDSLRQQSGLTLMRTNEAHAVMQHAHEDTEPGHGRKDAAVAAAGRAQTASPPHAAGDLTPEERVLRTHALAHTRASTALLHTCVAAYMHTSTGLAPETIDFSSQFAGARGGISSASASAAAQGADTRQPLRLDRESDLLGELFTVDQPKYILRPETVESLLVLYRLTGDESYRDAGWTIFENLSKSCKTRTAFSAIRDVNLGRGRTAARRDDDPADSYSPAQTQRDRREYSSPENWLDSQESFFLAETLKYLYLLFSPPDFMPLDRYVFNTEAHPLGVLVKH